MFKKYIVQIRLLNLEKVVFKIVLFKFEFNLNSNQTF